ncbi:sodium-dependent phosphate transport protein 2B-like isoform X6 [Monodelphis domestica]|uniref:sodium-dependent phosphate transport protein 2B-like isoform X6 n=1 Tax=Monodelphis domestica TaxID=13616 RepID=UPI000443152A|nr:sodium-dependent phosphate transport protein 2B-like isoform X6 [Monodelphis domestica]
MMLRKETKFKKKIIHFFSQAIMKVITFLLFFFFFTCSLDILSSAFQLIAGKVAREFLFGGPILFNPIACAMLGLLATVVVQSSSISASVLVSLVSSSFLTVETAIPVMMGVNVGTAITNILVALMYAGDREEFGRVFAGATVHSFFNWLTVLVLLPLELITGFLYHLSYRIMRSFKFQADDDDDDDGPELLKALTGPLTNIIIQLNKKVFTELAAGNQEAKNKSLIKIWCKTFENVTFSNVTVPSPENCTSPTLCWTEGNITWTLKNRTYQQNIAKCKHLFVNTSLSDSVIGFILLPLSLFILCGCLILFIRVLNSELRGPVAAVIKKYINTGTEVISLERVYCLTLGSNIGTTTTAILAALASPPRTFKQSLQIALCHFFFNITGILLWYPIPFIRLPLLFARRLGNITTTYRWFAIVYLIFSFFLGPLLVFCFSIASRTVLIYVGLPLYFLPFVVVYLHIFNVLKLFPLWMRDLKPWDDLITSIMVGCRQCGENLSHQWKKLQGPTLKPDPGPDQNHRPRAIEDSLFYVKKSDDTVSKNTINKWAVLNDSSAD